MICKRRSSREGESFKLADVELWAEGFGRRVCCLSFQALQFVEALSNRAAASIGGTSDSNSSSKNNENAEALKPLHERIRVSSVWFRV